MGLKMEFDRITSLPDDVTENILARLPLKEAVRTSILSRKWRYKSERLQDLVFDDQCVSTQSHPTCSFVNIVDHVLLVHTGPIRKFKLSRKETLATRDMDRWILHLSRNPVIKEMIIEFWIGNPYNIPSCLFFCQDIAYLELFRCLLNPPPSTCKGFRSLKTLFLENVTMAQDVFENLIGCSPLLEILTLISCDGFTNLKIDAPKLRLIDIIGVFVEFEFVDSLNLVDASFDLQVVVDQRGNCSNSGNLLRFFDHQLPHIRRLTIKSNFLKYLSIGALPLKLPKPCQYLNFLSLDMNFDKLDEISTVLCLLGSSPTLQELQILVDPEKDHAAVGEVESCLYDNYNCAYTQLRLVKITKISCVQAQLDFIKFLLLSSPVLERMTVQPASLDGFSKLVKDLLLFKRDSRRAEIMLLDP
ncbi:putative F-box domain, FBD domain, leucine-rich repeat domain, L domain-containing protein [Rosa chinensis]|uniref:Putative F-box domain, FBD domain, leucine-rich repeat domain, L domain-containing protein n=1 Tax=Rosa chinensis TaxID=74649 RepID=A0A2P6PK40_ROSCH|nr:F-box/FBD/LRR-repeat protein At1g13570 isoform X2 [Rosa chinensis]XP_024163454.1 F-box/FBD/LRR-repeat protein At1g13570 isoform X2 [Rosa chinensis]XP_024163455.1 F-box/FBD/LRR-repeat protein At1g13570 isoform X2 [Rosa chinensis]PRQ22289.1 putative F-box domain, FBD domain, leucine-rich repeat domain, L domain-containing protein [Rosa chinensis]